jgi:diguanylate cyclase (GGDEF)-like protein
MNRPPPHTGRGKLSIALIGLLTAALGLTVLIGWHLQSELLIRVLPGFVPMQYSTALGLVLSGLTLLALVTARCWLARLAAVALIAIGLIAIAEVTFNLHLGLERMLDATSVRTLQPGNMPPHASLAFILTGTAVLVTCFEQRLRYPSLWVGMAGTLTACLGLIPILGYLSGVREAYAWTGYTSVALHSAGGTALLGVGLIVLAAQLGRSERGAPPSPWVPASIAVGATLAAAMVWQALVANQTAQLAQNAQLAARNLRSELSSAITDEIELLQRMAAAIEATGAPPDEGWWTGARFLAQQERYLGLAWVGPDYRVRAVVPASNRNFVGADLSQDIDQRRTMFRALQERTTAVSPSFDLGSEHGFFAYQPVYWDGIFGGFLLAAFQIESLVQRILRQELGQSYGIAIYGSDGLLYQSHVIPEEVPVQYMPIDLADMDWQLAVWPLPELQERFGSILPVVVLVVGVLMAALLAFAVRAKQLLERSAHHVQELNTTLEQRVAQRTTALVASNQKLASEVAERERIAEELEYLAKFDPLTGLPNRVLFNEHLHQAVARAGRGGNAFAVFFLDLDNFKDINDTLGHHTGDLLLQAVAARLRGVLRESDIIGRLGGDEFLILVEELPHTDDCINVAEKILEVLKPPFQLGDNVALVSTSIGIATYPEAGTDPNTLIKHADSAMYQAKAEGRNTFALYSTRLHQQAMRRVELKRQLQGALEQDEFVVYYQPKVTLRDGQICGGEALVRWRHQGKLIPPNEFIPLTEETGLIVPLGSLVLQRVCEDLADWQRQGIPLPALSVNVSAKQFKHDRLLEDLRGCLQKHPALAQHLELELTERVFIEDSEAHRKLLREVEALGVTISIDDFGTGCSSFAYFRYFPIHTVKIDGSFIRNVTHDSHDAKITETVLDLAQNFEIKVIAEGVETAEQMQFLKERHCDEAQGYYFGRPVPSGEFVGLWLRHGMGRPQLH